jgi:hypothetical protein
MVLHPMFETLVMTVIMVNAIMMALTYYGMSDSLASATQYANYAFTLFFLLEMLIKWWGLGIKRYFR